MPIEDKKDPTKTTDSTSKTGSLTLTAKTKPIIPDDSHHTFTLVKSEENKSTLTLVEKEKTTKNSLTLVNKDKPTQTFTVVNKSPDQTTEEEYKPEFAAMGYFPSIELEQDGSKSYLADQISPIRSIAEALGAVTKPDYKDKQHTSTIWQLSLNSPSEFADYRLKVINELFRPLNELLPLANLDTQDILNNKEHLKKYIQSYKKIYHKIFEEVGLEFIEKADFDVASLSPDQKDLLLGIIGDIKPHLAYAKLYADTEITKFGNGMEFKKNGKTLLTIDSELRHTENKNSQRYTTSYTLGKDLGDAEMKLALTQMAEEMSQRRIFTTTGVKLDPSTNPAQLLFIMKELICVRGMRVSNFKEIKESILQQLPNADSLLIDLHGINNITDPMSTKILLSEANGHKAFEHRNQRINVHKEIDKYLHENNITLVSTDNPQANQNTPPTAPNTNKVGVSTGHGHGHTPT